jgi:hypothetical protein
MKAIKKQSLSIVFGKNFQDLMLKMDLTKIQNMFLFHIKQITMLARTTDKKNNLFPSQAIHK